MICEGGENIFEKTNLFLVEVENENYLSTTFGGVKTNKVWDKEGECGGNCLWGYSSSDSILYIYGEGNMTDYLSKTEQPWGEYRNEI